MLFNELFCVETTYESALHFPLAFKLFFLFFFVCVELCLHFVHVPSNTEYTD